MKARTIGKQEESFTRAVMLQTAVHILNGCSDEDFSKAFEEVMAMDAESSKEEYLAMIEKTKGAINEIRRLF